MRIEQQGQDHLLAAEAMKRARGPWKRPERLRQILVFKEALLEAEIAVGSFGKQKVCGFRPP